VTAHVAAIVPVVDEQGAIGDVVDGLRAAGACCVFVVDGGSRDGTRDAAVAAGALVIDEAHRGYGRACLTGAERALKPGDEGHVHEAIAFLDGDGSCDPRDLPTLLAALADADVVLGRRPGSLLEAEAMPWHARFGNGLVAWLISRRSGRRVHDLPPFKVLRRGTLERLGLDDVGYGWTAQLVARTLDEPSIRVSEVPIAFRARRGGVSKVSGSWKASIRAGRAMVAVATRETRSKPVVALMAKAPGRGHAKTRLAADLGEEHTAALWTACLADVADVVYAGARSARVRAIVMLATPADLEPVGQIIGPNWTPIVQDRPGLAGALIEVFLAAFDQGADRAIAVAADVPALPPTLIRDALAVLDDLMDSAAIGPSSDGGYHLVGLRWTSAPRWLPRWIRQRLRARLAQRLESVFLDVAMGGSSAREATTRTLRQAGWHVTTVASWPDIDTLADLRTLAHRLEDDGRWAPQTVAWVADHRTTIDGALTPAVREQREPP
jgi:glycosyltransferase A (GT-A) superfamily protein (DUF2064 family)